MDVAFARREKADAGSTEPHGDAQGLAIAHHNISAHRARCLIHCQCGRVGNYTHQCAFRVRGVDQFCVIEDATEEIRILDDEETRIFIHSIRQHIGIRPDA